MIERDAEIDVRLDPVGGEVQYLAVTIDSLREHAGILFAIQRNFENFFGRASGELMRLGVLLGETERKRPLAADGIERAIRAGRNDEDFAAKFDEAKFLERGVRFTELRREFLLHETEGATDATRGNAAVGEAFDGAKGDEVAKAIEVFAPAGVGRNQAQALPIAQAVRVQAQNAACFFSGEALVQASGPRVAKKF